MSSRPPSRSASSSLSRSVSSNSLPKPKETSTVELSAADKEKEARIAAACQDRDLGALIELATSTSGLITDSSRRTAWPILLGCSGEEKQKQAWTELPAHKDEHQVGLDVNRAFVYYPKNDSEKQLDRRKEELSRVILEVLRRHPTLCYFQGYHDIVQVFLLVLGADSAPDAVARLSLLRVRDFMLSNIDAALAQLELLRPIFRAADPELYEHLPKSQPSFALANTITMFAHNIQDYKDITRLFDFFLAQDAVMPIYLFAAVVLSRREDLLEVDKEDEDILYVLLGKLPQPFDVEFHLARTLELFERLPPASLASWEWWRIPSSSVLKSSADIKSIQTLTLQDGERLLAQHEREIKRQQTIRKTTILLRKNFWYYRRYGYAGLAVLVGAYALWLGRNGSLASTRYPLFGPLGDMLRRLASFTTTR